MEKRKIHAGRSSLERILWASLFVPAPTGRRGLPFVLVGDSGTVKSSLCRELARIAGIHFGSVIASIRQPPDFLGMPMLGRMPLTTYNQHLSPDGDDSIGVCSYAPPQFAIDAAMARRSLLLLDEVNTCPPAVQAALLRVLFEGVCGDLSLPEGVRMILAMNETADAAGGWDVALPLANRVGWLSWEGPSVTRFGEYLIEGGGCRVNGKLRREVVAAVDASAEEAAVDAMWSDAWARATGAMVGYLQSNPSAAHQKPKPQDQAQHRAWPSLRTWDFATAARAMGHVYDLSETEVRTATRAFIGSSADAEQFQWEKSNDLPDVSDFLDGKVRFEHSASRLDRTAAVLAGATAKVVDPTCELRKDRARVLWSYLLKLPPDACDVAMSSVVSLANARLMIGEPEAYRVFARMEPFMVAAGITPPAEGQ